MALRTLGEGVVEPVTVPGGGVADPGDTPIPNENEPAVTWPSAFETVRHVTVYTPSGRSPTGTAISTLLPGTSSGPPVSTAFPDESSTCTTVRPISGGSVNVIRT